jgi:hypothetical protein
MEINAPYGNIVINQLILKQVTGIKIAHYQINVKINSRSFANPICGTKSVSIKEI